MAGAQTPRSLLTIIRGGPKTNPRKDKSRYSQFPWALILSGITAPCWPLFSAHLSTPARAVILSSGQVEFPSSCGTYSPGLVQLVSGTVGVHSWSIASVIFLSNIGTGSVPQGGKKKHTKLIIFLDTYGSYGYRGRDCRNNLYLLPTGETVYFIASVVVLYNVEEQLQRHYSGHNDDVKWWVMVGTAGKRVPLRE